MKKDCKTLFLIYQCVDTNNFEKVNDCEFSKRACEILEKVCAWTDKTMVVLRWQTHIRQLELIQMEEKETKQRFHIENYLIDEPSKSMWRNDHGEV